MKETEKYYPLKDEDDNPPVSGFKLSRRKRTFGEKTWVWCSLGGRLALPQVFIRRGRKVPSLLSSSTE